MDPLSITAGVLALLEACHATGKLFLKIRMLDAPNLLQSLNNEITDLHLVLLDMSDYIRSVDIQGLDSSTVNDTLFQLCSSTLQQARAKVQETETLIHYDILKPGREHEFKVNRTAFLQHHSRLVQLQTHLRDARQKIVGLASHLGLRKFSRVEVLLNDIHSNNLPLLMQSQTELQRTLDQILRLQQSTSSTTSQSHQYASFGEASNISGIQMSVSRTRCACPLRAVSAQHSTILGVLFTGYAAAPRTGPCRGHCSRHKEMKIWLHYVFPSWFLQYAIRFEAGSGRDSGTIRCSLTVAQTITHDHVVWDLIDIDDFDAIKSLIISGQLSVDAQTFDPFHNTALLVR